MTSSKDLSDIDLSKNYVLKTATGGYDGHGQKVIRSEEDLEEALERLELGLKYAKKTEQLHFVRPRNVEILKKVMSMKNIDVIDGFVLPKITHENIQDYLDVLPESHNFMLMPTLETAEVFEISHMKRLRDILLPVQDKILALRVGGNDLLNCLGMRRPKSGTIYDTPVGLAIHNLVQIFKPADLMCGLVCKTAIHPSQIHIIEKHYEVNNQDIEMAEAILDKDAPAVFRMHGTMCEPATHRKWAEQILIRLNVYGNLK